MTLFNPSDIDPKKPRIESDAAFANHAAHLNYSGAAADFVIALRSLIPEASRSRISIDFVTAGNFSLHNIIEELILKLGICNDCFISAWAIKEAGARSLASLKSKGKIIRLHGVFDHRIKTLEVSALQLVEKYFDQIEYTNCHAKVVLLNFKDYYVTVLTSANLSRNPRIEAGLISFSQHTYSFHRAWMIKVLNGNNIR